MRVCRLGGVIGCAAVAMLAGMPVALASTPPPITVASSQVGGPPVLLVDSRGTVNVLWTGTEHGGLPTVRYARRPAGAKHFKQIALPHMPSTQGNPFIYEPSPGSLEVIVNVNGSIDLDGWISRNDGASWSHLPSTPREKWAADGLYLQASSFFPAPGGPIDYAGSTGADGPIVQLNSSLSKATTVGNAMNGILVQGLGRNSAGVVFVLGAPADASSPKPTALPFQAGANTGSLIFPCAGAAAVAGTSYKMAVGRSAAVVAFAGCGHVWTRTLSAAGAVGPLLRIGSAPVANASGQGTNGTAWVSVLAAGNGSFTAAFTTPGSDIGVAHSSDGSHWTAARGLVPVQGAFPVYGNGRSLSQGNATWYGSAPETTGQSYQIQLMPLSETYRPPGPPSGRGFGSPRKGVLGSLAVTAPGAIAKKAFEQSGHAPARVLDALGGKVTAEVSVTHSQGHTTYDICSGSLVASLAPGRARTISIPCASGAVVIGGSGSSGVVVKKGYVVTYTFLGRNGSITLVSRIS